MEAVGGWIRSTLTMKREKKQKCPCCKMFKKQIAVMVALLKRVVTLNSKAAKNALCGASVCEQCGDTQTSVDEGRETAGDRNITVVRLRLGDQCIYHPVEVFSDPTQARNIGDDWGELLTRHGLLTFRLFFSPGHPKSSTLIAIQRCHVWGWSLM